MREELENICFGLIRFEALLNMKNKAKRTLKMLVNVEATAQSIKLVQARWCKVKKSTLYMLEWKKASRKSVMGVKL